MEETAPPELRIEPGDVLAGKYRVEGEIGSGGMGIVVSARHVTMGNRVAIKLLKLHEEKDPRGAVARFVREARAAARVQSDHVVRVPATSSSLTDGTPYMVMEHLEGRTSGRSSSAAATPGRRGDRLRAAGVRRARRGARGGGHSP